MCGIIGIVNRQGIALQQLWTMGDTLKHRGPDDEGYLLTNTLTGAYDLAGGRDTPMDVFASPFLHAPVKSIDQIQRQYNLALAHRRLAIIDLSPAGHQPMCNEDQTLWIIHNCAIWLKD